ncbi:MAG: hypothetical protein IKS90_02700 [Clostridia bacterium]|nr:hypothetical protein [Clostridia bacterium]
MATTNNHAPLFSGKYYKELLKELKTIGIIFAAIQVFFGFLGAFGIGQGLALLVFGTTSGGSLSSNIYSIFFIVAAFNFYIGHIARNSWDFRLSLPIAKKTMIVSHMAAVLTYAALIFVANYVGVLIGELVRLIPGAGGGSVPVGFGEQAVSLIKALLEGVATYSGLIILACIIGRFMTLLIAAGSALVLPDLFSGFVAAVRERGLNTLSIILPVGIRGMKVLSWALLVFGAVALTVIAVVAYSKHRVETSGKPARAPWIHILIGLAFAAAAGLLAAIIGAAYYWTHYDAALDNKGVIIGPIIAVILVMIIAYFVYMWISMKSFKGAAKRLMFLPIAMLVILAAFPIAKGVDKKWEKLDFSASNIKYVRVTDAAFGNVSGIYTMIYDFGSVAKGDSGVYNIKLTDPAVIDIASKSAIEYKALGDGDNKSDFLSNMISGYLTASIDIAEITLNDGSKWALPMVSNEYTSGLRNAALNNSEFIERAMSIDRVKNGRVVDPDWLGRDFSKVLIGELEKLTPEERASVMYEFSEIDLHYDGSVIGGYTSVTPVDQDVYATVSLASWSYDHLIKVRLNDKLPESSKLYMQKSAERFHKANDFADMVDRLKSGKYDEVYGDLTFIGGGQTEWCNIASCKGEYSGAQEKMQQDAIKRLGEILENSRGSVGKEKNIVSFNLNVYSVDGAAGRRYSFNFGSGFFALNDKDFEELKSIMLNAFSNNSYDEIQENDV